jgi:uncharacterized membrane protein YqjE
MKEFKLVEHNLIPLSLFVLNLSVVQLIYLVFMAKLASLLAFIILASTIVLIAGVVKKNKYLMAPAMTIYILALIFSLY